MPKLIIKNVNKVYKLRRNGASVIDIAKVFGVTRAAIYYWLKKPVDKPH